MSCPGRRADAAATVVLALALAALAACGSGERAAEPAATGIPERGERATEPAATGSSGGVPRWEIVDLGTPFGDGGGAGEALNDAGQIAGDWQPRQESAQPAVWTDGKLRPIARGRECGVATAINEAGDVVGWRCSEAAVLDGFLWRRGRTTVLPPADAQYLDDHHAASDVNSRGQVVGTSADWGNDEDPSTWESPRAWLWDDGEFTEPGDLGGGWSIARALNDEGVVVGESATAAGETHAFLWRDGVLTDLGTLPGHVASAATGVNARGQVVGFSSAAGDDSSEAVLWEHGRVTALTAGAGANCRATDVNDRGQIVGQCGATSALPHAFVWEDGKLTDLGTLPGRDRASGAVAITRGGEILGWSEAGPGEPPHTVLWRFRE